MSSTKMKGLLKDEEKEEEMQIGNPTDVKHVAHIGWDGPAAGAGAVVDSSPSWMKEFSSTTGFSAPLGPPPDSNEGPEVKWVSEDSKRGQNRSAASSPNKDLPELPKSSRRHSDNNTNNSNESPRKQKPRQSRRQQAKDALDSVLKSSQESTSSVPNIPRKSRRKKSKEINGGVDGGGSTRSRSKATPSDSTENVCSDPGLAPDTSLGLVKNQDLA
ncbi:hypothetical protein CASFOL_028106 [Castilleja foliolosa]|uniref:CRIB domain-containing protein n=1 Tax=Castilleja foliolosa TaxID=1961234 RepID=A0ABD3CEN1_9LAMI